MDPVVRSFVARPSWRGIFAGLLMGLVVVMAMTALALVIGSFLSLDLQGAGVTASVYAVVTALLSAFTAGYFAVKASAPEAVLGDGVAIDPKTATLTGMLTASLIVVATSYFTMSGATSLVRGTANVAGSAISGTASAVAGVGGAATTAIGSDILADAKASYNKVTGNFERSDIEALLAKNIDDVDEAQIRATADVLVELLEQTKQDAANLDFSSLDTWQNLDQYAKERLLKIEQVLAGDELIVRLQEKGLSAEQAQDVRTKAIMVYDDYKAQAEATIAQTRANIDQAVVEAKEAARKAALYAGLFWLISAFFTFVASIFGAKTAAVNYRR